MKSRWWLSLAAVVVAAVELLRRKIFAKHEEVQESVQAKVVPVEHTIVIVPVR